MRRLVGNCNPSFARITRNWCVDFLPFLESPSGEAAESVIGYPNPNRGHGYGAWAEFYERETEARERFAELIATGIMDRGELIGPDGQTVDEHT